MRVSNAHQARITETPLELAEVGVLRPRFLLPSSSPTEIHAYEYLNAPKESTDTAKLTKQAETPCCAC